MESKLKIEQVFSVIDKLIGLCPGEVKGYPDNYGTKQDIIDAEKELGVKFPEDFKKLRDADIRLLGNIKYNFYYASLPPNYLDNKIDIIIECINELQYDWKRNIANYATIITVL